MDAPPPLFSRVSGALFGPLAGNHAALYWSLLSTLYHYEFEREPFFLLRGVVVDTTEELVRESPAWSERRLFVIARNSSFTAQARGSRDGIHDRHRGAVGSRPGPHPGLRGYTAVDGTQRKVNVTLRMCTAIEFDEYVHGGILPDVLRQLRAA